MATAVENFNGAIAQIAVDIGDLIEGQTATEANITAMQDQINAIDVTSIISNNPAATGTDIVWSVDVITSKLAQAKAEIVGGAPEAYETLGLVGGEIDLLKGRIDLLEQKMAALEAKFDNSGVLKAEFLPSYVTEGMQFKGVFDPTVDTLPVPDNSTNGDMYKVNATGTVNTVAGVTNVKAGDTLIGSENGWYAIANQDLVTSVNGKTGNVVLVGTDIGFTASLASGLNAADVASGLNELAEKTKTFMDAFGDPAALLGVDSYLAMRNAAATDGVNPSPVPSV